MREQAQKQMARSSALRDRERAGAESTLTESLYLTFACAAGFEVTPDLPAEYIAPGYFVYTLRLVGALCPAIDREGLHRICIFAPGRDVSILLTKLFAMIILSQASLVEGPACALYVTTENHDGKDVTMQLCILRPNTCDTMVRHQTARPSG